ncbi:hypothetical protein D3C75_1131430 [compost metagenome]
MKVCTADVKDTSRGVFLLPVVPNRHYCLKDRITTSLFNFFFSTYRTRAHTKARTSKVEPVIQTMERLSGVNPSLFMNVPGSVAAKMNKTELTDRQVRILSGDFDNMESKVSVLVTQ